jgi:protein O-mannosyl-transferase
MTKQFVLLCTNLYFALLCPLNRGVVRLLRNQFIICLIPGKYSTMNLKNVKKVTAPSKPVKPEISKAPPFRIYYLLIVAFSFVLYGNTISNRYALDDFYVTANNPLVQQGIKAIPAIFTSYYININAEEGGQHNYGYRPIAKATFAIEWQIFGENPHVSHFINILLYALTGIIAFPAFAKTAEESSCVLPFSYSHAFSCPSFAYRGCCQPQKPEELLSFLGALLALKYFLKFHETGKKLNLLWGALSLALGFLSKANIVTFLFIIPMIFYFFADVKPRKNILLGCDDGNSDHHSTGAQAFSGNINPSDTVY